MEKEMEQLELIPKAERKLKIEYTWISDLVDIGRAMENMNWHHELDKRREIYVRLWCVARDLGNLADEA